MRSLLLCALACLLAGCSTPSIGPAYTEEIVVYDDEAYVGTWLDQDRTGRYRVERGQRIGYEVRYQRLDTDDPFVPLDVLIVVFEVAGTRFFDAFPGDREIQRVSDRSGMLFLPVHSFGRVRVEGETLRLDFVDINWMNDQRATLETAHTTVENNVVLTAGPEELQKLLERAASDESAFSDDSLILSREGGGG